MFYETNKILCWNYKNKKVLKIFLFFYFYCFFGNLNESESCEELIIHILEGKFIADVQKSLEAKFSHLF